MKNFVKNLVVMLVLLVGIADASVLPRGVLMCNNPDSVRILVKLDREGKTSEFLEYFSKMEAARICSTTVMPMNPDLLGRVDLPGGVTQIGSIFVATSDIKE